MTRKEEMYLPIHLQRHPFGRVPALLRDDFMLYETNAIAAHVDEVSRAEAHAGQSPQACPHEPADRQSELVLLPGIHLSRDTRAAHLPSSEVPAMT
jgi:glutathione S-transferase